MSRFYEYYKSTVRPAMICQYNYVNVKEVPQITFVRLGFAFTNLTGEEDWRLLKSLQFLSVITGQKASLGKVRWSSAGGRERRMVGNCFVTLRGAAAYNFLEYLVFIVLPLNLRRYGLLDSKVGESGVYNFVLRDLGVFFRQNENLIGFEGKLQISVSTSGKNKEEVESLLRWLGVII